jgi:uncharacterized protein YndB with AHSA1/START domain
MAMPANAVAAEVVQREVRIDAPPSAVFGFLTQPEKMVRWMGVEATLDPRPGGVYRVDLTGDERVSGEVSGEVLEVAPDRKLVFTWGWENGILPVPPGASTVEIVLEPDGEGTLVRLTHRDLPEEMRSYHTRGWDHSLARLAVVAAGGDPGPDPLRSIVRSTRIFARTLPARYLYLFALRRLRAGRQRREARQPD